jgi:alpha-L-rhamnosidase
MKKIFLFLIISQAVFAQLTQEINPELLQKPWTASWISYPNTTGKNYETFNFRKSFDLAEKPAIFIIHISADNRYWLYVNGERICTGPAKGDLAHWRFESLDITAYLKQGKNTIAAVVWNHGDYRAWWQISHKTGLLIQGNSNKEAVVNTDNSWKVMQNVCYVPLFDDHRVIGAREQIFGQNFPWNWEKPGFDDSKWTTAVISEKAVPAGSTETSERKLVQRTIALPEETMQRFGTIRKMEGLPQEDGFIKGTGDLKVYPWGNITILIDQQTLTTAYPELLISGGKGGKITLTYMESPFINVQQEYKGNRNEIEGKIVHGIYDVVYPDGEDKRLYRPLYYRTFRYVQVKIENYLQPLVIHDFYSKFTGYPFKENASFTSSDASLKDIWNIGWRTARLCAFETYMDCPYYEQLQYVGDTRIQALVSLYVSGDDRLMKNAISLYSDSRTPEGLTKSRYPDYLEQVIPPFSLFWTVMIHDFWKHRTDDVFVKQYLQGVKEVLDWHTARIDPATNMLGKLTHWNFVDWPKEWPWTGSDRGSGLPKGGDDGGSAIHTLQLVFAMDKAIEIFNAYGMKTEAAKHKEISERLKKATYKLCWDDKKKMLSDLAGKTAFSQHANVMAVLTGIVATEQAKALMQNIVADTSIVQCTVYYRFYLNQAMKKAGLGDAYIEMLTPWKNMLKIGLTTFAEKPEPSRSDCHAWSSSPNYDLLATVIGVEPASAGFKTVKIVPNLGKLTSAEGKVPHPNGEILVKLKRKGKDGIDAQITLPKYVTGTFTWNRKVIKLKSGLQVLGL